MGAAMQCAWVLAALVLLVPPCAGALEELEVTPHSVSSAAEQVHAGHSHCWCSTNRKSVPHDEKLEVTLDQREAENAKAVAEARMEAKGRAATEEDLRAAGG